MADAGSNLGKLTPKYDFSQYRYREIASRSLTIENFEIKSDIKEEITETKIEVNEDNDKVYIKQEELQDNLHAFLYDTRYVVEI